MAEATLYITKDTYLAQASSDLGNSATLACGQIVVFNVPVRNRIVVELDLRPLANSRIDSAVLRFTLLSASFLDGPHTLSVHEVQGEWDEATADWTERTNGTNWTTAGGDYWPWTVITQTINNGDTSLSLDISDYVERHRGEVVSLILELPEGSSDHNHYFTCHSSDAATLSNRPQLIVQHETATGAPLQWDTLGYGQLHWTTEGTEPPPLQWNELATHPVHWS
jgi:hypothetical protein